MRILLADDDPKLQVIMQLWLRRGGHEIEAVLNGQEALDRLQKRRFDGLITDVNMPLLSGVELVKSVLQLPAKPGLIVMLTSRCDTAELTQDINSDRVHILTKPFSPAALAELVEKLNPTNAVSL